MHHSLIIAMVFVATLSFSACRAGPSGPQVSVEDAWSRPVPAAGGNSAIFMRLVNGGSEADQLLGGVSLLAGAVEVHKTTMEEGVMKMEHSPRLEIPAKGEVSLEPGGYHVMLIGVNRALQAGDTLPITLNFEKSGEMQLEVQVREVK